MRIQRCVITPILAGLYSLVSLDCLPITGLAHVQAQAENSKSDQHPSPTSSQPSNSATPGVSELFHRHCAKCHGKDGTGTPARRSFPDIPDLTDIPWQSLRSDAQLLDSILKGKGEDMPGFARKINEKEARSLVPHIRSFAPATGKTSKEKAEKLDSSSFEDQFSDLQEEMDRLRRQFRESSQAPRHETGKPSESSSKKGDEPTSAKSAKTSAIAELFQQHCVKCHGADGTGSRVRKRLPKIPDFTDSAWQARRTDKQMQSSILNGKGKEMPPMGVKINDKQARQLVAYIRSFASTETGSEQEKTPPLTFQMKAQKRYGNNPKVELLDAGRLQALAIEPHHIPAVPFGLPFRRKLTCEATRLRKPHRC